MLVVANRPATLDSGRLLAPGEIAKVPDSDRIHVLIRERHLSVVSEAKPEAPKTVRQDRAQPDPSKED